MAQSWWQINIHHKKWLRRSNRNSAEGELLNNICREGGLQQLVQEATRGDYILDLAITEVEDAKVKILPKIADHSCVLVHFKLPVPESDVTKRQVWSFKDADWEGLKNELSDAYWDKLKIMDVDEAAATWTKLVLAAAEKFIPRRWRRQQKSTHPWVDDTVVELVRQKIMAVGTERARAAARECSEGLKEEFAKYVEKEKKKLKQEKKASKGWWSRTRRLLQQKGKLCSVPALKTSTGVWCKTAKSKACHLAGTFRAKYTLDEAEDNEYTELEPNYYREQGQLMEITEDIAEKTLSELRRDSATGPDTILTIITKECAKQLARPLFILANRQIFGWCTGLFHYIRKTTCTQPATTGEYI